MYKKFKLLFMLDILFLTNLQTSISTIARKIDWFPITFS